jgi:hypothetical protein
MGALSRLRKKVQKKKKKRKSNILSIFSKENEKKKIRLAR